MLAGWGANAIGAGDLTMARPTGRAGNQYGFLKFKVSLQVGSLAGIDLAPVGGDSMQVERVVFAPNAGTLIAERTYIGGEISCNSPGRLECPPLLHNEPPRDSRRLHTVRSWSYDTAITAAFQS